MKKYRFSILITAAAILLVIGGMFLPELLMSRQEHILLGNVNETTVEINAAADAELPAEQVVLIAQNYWEYKNWVNYDPMPGQLSKTEALQRAKEEIQKLLDYGIVTDCFSDIESFQAAAKHGTKKYNDESSTVKIPVYGCWRIEFTKDDCQLLVYQNSVSGQILGLQMTEPYHAEQDTPEYLKRSLLSYLVYVGWYTDKYNLFEEETSLYCQLEDLSVMVFMGKDIYRNKQISYIGMY